MDEERLKNPPGPGHRDYFDELHRGDPRVRAAVDQKLLDIYTTSIDHKADADLPQRFFATVQSKMHQATHGHTAAEIPHRRVGSTSLTLGAA
jgi:hypothetical protein